MRLAIERALFWSGIFAESDAPKRRASTIDLFIYINYYNLIQSYPF
jgi:hypothetical protein